MGFLTKERIFTLLEADTTSAEMIVQSRSLDMQKFAVVRLAISIYCWVILIAHLAYFYLDGIFFTFFTHWSFILLTAYFTLSFTYRNTFFDQFT
jgi:hypothetical protein